MVPAVLVLILAGVVSANALLVALWRTRPRPLTARAVAKQVHRWKFLRPDIS